MKGLTAYYKDKDPGLFWTFDKVGTMFIYDVVFPEEVGYEHDGFVNFMWYTHFTNPEVRRAKLHYSTRKKCCYFISSGLRWYLDKFKFYSDADYEKAHKEFDEMIHRQ